MSKTTVLQESIIEGNKLIAEFRGFKLKEEFNRQKEYWWYEPGYSDIMTKEGTWCFKGAPPFHSSWNWLMPVVEKINKTCLTQLNNYDYDRGEAANHSFVIILSDGKYWNNCPYGGKPDRIWNQPQPNSMIKAVYDTVVHYIQWYNTNKTDKP